MKTVVAQLIDGKHIITGYGTPVIDPESSKPEINAILTRTQEALDVASKFDEISSVQQLAKDALNIARSLPSGTEKELKEAEYRNHLDSVQRKTDAELKPLNTALRLKAEELWASDSVVYFEPKQGEFIITDTEHEALTAQYPIATGKALEFDSTDNSGAIIDNLKGVKYWVDTAGVWSTNVVTSIGDSLPVGAIAESNLTTVQRGAIELQLEAERVAGLTVAEKDAEKLAAIGYATAQSVQLRSQYEIEGAVDPLADAQDWLAAEIVKIEAKYA